MNDLTIRNAHIIFRNFAGKGSDYNPEGRRNFSVAIEDENLIRDLSSDGWLLKPLKKRDENEPQRYHLPVSVFYGDHPPTIVMICGNNKILVTESMVKELDVAEIINVDLTIHPSIYKRMGREGVKAYLRTMIVTIREDELLSEIGFNPYVTNNNDEDIPF